MTATETAKKYKIQNFKYNGFSGQLGEGFAAYTATFKEWTADPGVARFDCSDGKQRIIPTFAVEDFNTDDHPQQESTGVIFGDACSSEESPAHEGKSHSCRSEAGNAHS